MRQCIALAGLACLLATGCAGTGMLGGKGCCEPCHVATSRNAARPNIMRDGCRPCCGFNLFGKDKCKQASCDDVCCGDGCCDDGCCGDDGCMTGCSDGSCGAKKSGRQRGKLLDGKMMCGVCGLAGGLCPHRGGYPEQTAFNPGPPTGQVAYPYYTVRGPRDFLMCNPPSIGPY